MSIPLDLGPEASTACISTVSPENPSDAVPYPSLSKIPLPKCLVESSVRIGRSRNELRNRSLAGVEPPKVGMYKRDSQENDLSPLYSKSEPRTFFTAARMRANEDVAVQAALTPISVNAFSAIDCQDEGSMTERSLQHTPASQFQQPKIPSRSGQPISNSKTPIKNKPCEWINDGGSRELKLEQTPVWSDAVCGTDQFNGEQNPCIEPDSSIHCVTPNSVHSASNETPFVSGAIPSLFTRNTGVAGPLSSRPMFCRHDGDMLSLEKLPSNCDRSSTVKLVESTRLSASGVLAGDSTFTKISSNGSYLEYDADCTMNSFSDCHSSDENYRAKSIVMEAEGAPLRSGDTNCGLDENQPLDLMSTKERSLDASLLEEEDCDLVAFQTNSVRDTDMANSLFTQCCEEHHTAATPCISVNFEDSSEPDNLYIVHNCREFLKDQSQFQAPFSHHALEHRTKKSLEAQLEDDSQRDIEDEISKEIFHLSQKLANLQARHGAQRMLNSPLPAGDDIYRRKRGRVVAAKVFQGNDHRTPESGTSEKVQQSRPVCGQGCAILNVQKVMRKERLERTCTSSKDHSATHKCAPSNEIGQQASQGEHRGHHGDDSRAGTPSSGSIRSNDTDCIHNELKARTLHVGVKSPQVFPDSNRRFKWEKTLRSGEPGIRGSPGSAVSKQPPKMLAPRKQLGEDSEFESEIRLDSANKKREVLLEDVTREPETRFNEFAVGATLERAQIPAAQETQGTRIVGRVVASRYANSPKSRLDIYSKGSISKDASEVYGCLDERTADHLMKAGLTIGLPGKKQGSYSKSKVVKSEKQGEKLPKGKSIGFQHGNTDPGHLCLSKHSYNDHPEQSSHTLSEMNETFETEYETFAEGPNDDSKISDLRTMTKNLQEQTPGKLERIRYNQDHLAEEGSTVPFKSRVSTLRSKTKGQAIKRTYIRCIEVVVDQPLANRSASAANENCSVLPTTQSRIPRSNKIELGALEGSFPSNSESVSATSNDNNLQPDMTDAKYNKELVTGSKIEVSKPVKTRDQPLETIFKIHGKIRQEEGCVQDMPSDLQVSSCDEESKTKVTTAAKPLVSSLTEWWEELINALEKERLPLPIIRTETGNVIVSSPRDFRCGKRITERLKSMQHFSPENCIPNGL